MRTQHDSGKEVVRGLRPLKFWQAFCYPIVLVIVGVFTWSKDQFFASLLPRRRFDDFVFKPDMFASAHMNTPIRVLVVDDSDVHQEVSLRLLTRTGSIADFASNGAEAVEACRRHRYDLVLMDLSMPGMSGLDAAQEIRRESSSKNVRIIAVSGQLPMRLDESDSSAVDGYLAKPLIASELQRQLRVSSALRCKAG